MSANNLIQSFGNLCGWTKATMIDVLCQYIDNQEDNDALADFLQRLADDEGHHNIMNPSCEESVHGALRTGDCCPYCHDRVENIESDGLIEIRCVGDGDTGCGALLWDEKSGDHFREFREVVEDDKDGKDHFAYVMAGGEPSPKVKSDLQTLTMRDLPDGTMIEMEIQLYGGPSPWLQAVLYHDGNEVRCSDVLDEYVGEHKFFYIDAWYIVEVL